MESLTNSNSRRDEIAREAAKNNFCDVVESIHVEVDSDRTITILTLR
jgi:hypothetical protein